MSTAKAPLTEAEKGALAIRIVRDMARRWYAVDGESASDILDEELEAGHGSIYLTSDITTWIDAEDEVA